MCSSQRLESGPAQLYKHVMSHRGVWIGVGLCVAGLTIWWIKTYVTSPSGMACGDELFRPNGIPSTVWSQYECKAPEEAAELYERSCLRPMNYTEAPSKACPAQTRCCPPPW